MSKVVVLLSGGLDSTTLLYYVKKKGYKPYCLILDYGQRHKCEIQSAKKIAREARVPYQEIQISLPWQGSSLLNLKEKIPQRSRIDLKEIPSTYVPARNIIFLSFAASYAEAVKAETIFIGANAVDYSGYPDCRPEFFKAYQRVLKVGQKSGVKGRSIKVNAPFVRKTKAQIVRVGMNLNVPYHLTWSCYKGGKRPCGVCDSCVLRQKGFDQLKQKDPALKR